MGPLLYPEQSGLVDDRTKKEAITQMISQPQTPVQQLMERDGRGKTFGKMLLNTLSGGLLTPVLHPELPSMRQRYASDLDLWKEYRKMGLVDPQDQALADAIRAGEKGPELMALQAEASGVDKLNLDSYTESPGQIRRDAFGNEISRGGPPVINPTAAMQDASAIAQTRGIPKDSPFYGDLVAAVTEPTETRVDGNGNTYSVNTVSEVLSRWDEHQSKQPAQGGEAVSQAGGPEQAGNSSQPQAGQGQGFNSLGPVLDGLNKKQAEFVTAAPDKLKFYNRFSTNLAQLGEWDEENQRFVLNEDATDLYGSWDGNPLNPQNWNGWGKEGDAGGFGGGTEFFMPQGNRDAKAVVEQLIESLAVDERGQLKGQGQITEGETAMLRAAVTRAAKRGMGDKAANDEFTRLYLELQKSMAEQQGMVDRYWPENPNALGSSNIELEFINLDDEENQ
jgi:hypothetical protein